VSVDITNPAVVLDRVSVLILNAVDARKVLRDPMTAPRVRGVLSISDPPHYSTALRPLPEDFARVRDAANAVLCLDFLDKVTPGFGGPEPEHVEQILAWGRRFHDAFNNPAWPGIVIIHCHQGISRSTAAALACFAQALGPNNHDDAVRMMYGSAAEWRMYGSGITPNELLIEHADRLLGRGGALVKAAS
jgi:predicted protein tyrosine phosphatase